MKLSNERNVEGKNCEIANCDKQAFAYCNYQKFNSGGQKMIFEGCGKRLCLNHIKPLKKFDGITNRESIYEGYHCKYNKGDIVNGAELKYER